MKRVVGAALTAAVFMLVPAAGGAAEPRNVYPAASLIHSDIAQLNVLECDARSAGPGVSSTSITLCRISYADGASFSARPVTVPSTRAVTARAFRHPDTANTICVGAIARYRDGTAIARTSCSTSN